MRRFWQWVLGAVGVLVIGALLGAVLAEVVDQQRDLEEARDANAALSESVDALRDQVLDLGETPEAPPPEPAERGERGVQGPRGPRGRAPTTAEVTQAVSAYLRANPPQPGRPPSEAEIIAAVATYCADNTCDGPPGPPGPAGADSAVPGPAGPAGPAGPGPSDEQVAAAVTAYCDARNGCTGPQGPQGEPGPSCPEGYSLQPSTVRGDDVVVCTREPEP